MYLLQWLRKSVIIRAESFIALKSIMIYAARDNEGNQCLTRVNVDILS